MSFKAEKSEPQALLAESIEEKTPFLSHDAQHSLPAKRTNEDRRYYTLLTCVSFFTAAVFAFSAYWFQPSAKICIRRLSDWSPMLEGVEYNYLKDGQKPNKRFMGTPTTELEGAWAKLWQFGSLGIAEKDLPLLNKSMSEYPWHFLESEKGGGIQAYFEGFHQLHCLNLARQYLHREEYDYSHERTFSNPDMPVLEHVEHCLEILRTKLMCEADTVPYYVVHKGHGRMKIETRVKKSCRNFDKMVDWANMHITVPLKTQSL